MLLMLKYLYVTDSRLCSGLTTMGIMSMVLVKNWLKHTSLGRCLSGRDHYLGEVCAMGTKLRWLLDRSTLKSARS